MARKAMITRTINGTKATALMVDTIEKKMYEEAIKLSRSFKDDNALLKAVKSVAEDDTHKVASIITAEPYSKRLGMSEETFIKYSEELPPLKA